MTKHYKLSPSAMGRILACPASLKLSEGAPKRSSSYAEEGTQAHDVAEQSLRTGCNAADICEDTEMAAAVQVYLDEVRSWQANRKPLHEWTETTWKHATIADFGGTTDHTMIYVEDGKLVLHLFDYKHGVGVPVDVEGNTQVLSYAEIVRSNLFGDFDLYRATIVQPRCTVGDAVKEWDFDQSVLDAHVERIHGISERLDEIKSGDHCRWCPALSFCPEVARLAKEAAELEEEEIKADKARLVELYEATPAIKAMLDKVPLLMMDHFKHGDGIPGYKVVHRIGHRAWLGHEDDIVSALALAGIDEDDLYDKKLKTPAKIEKIGGKDAKKLIKKLVHRPTVGHRIAPESAPGEPVGFTSVDIFGF